MILQLGEATITSGSQKFGVIPAACEGDSVGIPLGGKVGFSGSAAANRRVGGRDERGG